jgi:predicted LPLAT superfamily acyltransferase
MFLGREAEFPAGPFYLAMTHNVPVSFVFAMKESRKHYHFHASEPKSYHAAASGKQKKEVLAEIIGNFAGEMESMVRTYPLQWFNYYDFWEKTKSMNI